MQWPALQLWRLVDDGGTEMGRRKQYKALQMVKHTNVRLITNILGNDNLKQKFAIFFTTA